MVKLLSKQSQVVNSLNPNQYLLILVGFFLFITFQNLQTKEFPKSAVYGLWVGDSIESVEKKLTKSRLKFTKIPVKVNLNKLMVSKDKKCTFQKIPVLQTEIMFELNKLHTIRYTFDINQRTRLLQQLDNLYKEQANVISNGYDMTIEYSFDNAFVWVDFIKDKTSVYISAPR